MHLARATDEQIVRLDLRSDRTCDAPKRTRF